MSNKNDKEAFMPVSLLNARKGPYVYTVCSVFAAGEILGTPTIVKQGETSLFDPNNKSIQMAAKAGILVPTDKRSKEWLKSLNG